MPASSNLPTPIIEGLIQLLRSDAVLDRKLIENVVFDGEVEKLELRH